MKMAVATYYFDVLRLMLFEILFVQSFDSYSNGLAVKSSMDIEVIRTVFHFFFFYKENFKHLKHKQKASK